jgi:hypothetical protein
MFWVCIRNEHGCVSRWLKTILIFHGFHLYPEKYWDSIKIGHSRFVFILLILTADDVSSTHYTTPNERIIIY